MDRKLERPAGLDAAPASSFGQVPLANGRNREASVSVGCELRRSGWAPVIAALDALEHPRELSATYTAASVKPFGTFKLSKYLSQRM